jgi:hypothetical protein
MLCGTPNRFPTQRGRGRRFFEYLSDQWVGASGVPRTLISEVVSTDDANRVF